VGTTVNRSGRAEKRLYVTEETLRALAELKRPGSDTMDAVIQRLLRFHARFRPAAESELREEGLP